MSKIWQENINKLIQFKAEFGHVNVPKSYEDKKLARLVTTLRQQKRYGTLKAERELALHQINFDFEPLESTWLESYHKMVEYYRLNGHSFPARRSENKHVRALADWVNRMHKMVREHSLSEEKIIKLKMINIDGNPAKHKLNKLGIPKSFDKMLSCLKKYINENSPLIHSQMANPVLYSWVLFQQQRINASLITAKEFSLLINTEFKIEKEVTTFLKEGSNHV